MSKSLKNVVNPDDVVSKFGADSFRLYEMFMGPLDERKPWDDKNVKGPFNFLSRVFRFFSNPENINGGKDDDEILKGLNKAIKKVGEDIENLKFNTAISEMMILLNLFYKKEKITGETASKFVKIISPFAPHLAEELWQQPGKEKTIAFETWPVYNEVYLKEDLIEYPVSFNGKMRFKITLPADLGRDEIINHVLSDERASKWLGTSTPSNVIVVPKKIVNVVFK
jgi:leucyl-tRNA synthetase